MPTVKDRLKEAADAEKNAEPIEDLKEGFDKGLAWARYNFRDMDFKITELPIGEYDDIVKKATRKQTVEDPDTGAKQEVEILDQQLQSRLMLTACIVEPKGVKVNELGTRLVVALNRVVNRLHYGDEPDALRPTKKDGDDDEEGKGAR